MHRSGGSQKVDRFVCLGDTVGYGADPNAACDLVRSKCEFTVLGNHDAAVAGRMDYSYYYAAAREVLDWTALQLSQKTCSGCAGCPTSTRKARCSTATPRRAIPRPSSTCSRSSRRRTWCCGPKSWRRLTFIGHSHLQRAFCSAPPVKDVLDGARAHRRGEAIPRSPSGAADSRGTTIRAPWYGIWDDQAKVVEFHRVAYNAEKTARKILEAGLSPHFARRLLHGV